MVAIHAPCLLPASFGRCLTRPNVLKQASFVRLQEANTAPEKSSDTFSRLLGIFTNQGMDLFNGEEVQNDHRGLQLNDEGLVQIKFYKSVAVAVAGHPGQATH